MPVFQTSRRVSVDAATAYAVAADVGSYREFLPLMQRSVVRGARVPTDKGQRFDAELAVAYPKLGLSESFVSRVETNDADRSVTAHSTDGPFRAIETEWKITPVGEVCTVAIRIDYAFRNPLIQLAAGGLMEMAIQKVMAAFETRARDVQRKASSNS
jgi:coenzyme Q-binding protein COQ10